MQSSLMFKDEENAQKWPRMTKDSLRAHCKKLKLYLTPHLNDVLYLHYHGFSKIENLEEYTGLKCLWLENNGIDKIENLDHQKEMRSLYLHHNLIKNIENLEDECPLLDTLVLSHNSITSINNLSKLKHLQTLNLSHNRLESYSDVEHLKECTTISCVDLSHNFLEDTNILNIFAAMESLKVLYLIGNPVIKGISSYRKTIIVQCKELTYLDDRPVFPKDRAAAEAWSVGGLEAERECRQKWADDERRKIHDSVMSIIRLRDEARAKRAVEEYTRETGILLEPDTSSEDEIDENGGQGDSEEIPPTDGLIFPWQVNDNRRANEAGEGGRSLIIEMPDPEPVSTQQSLAYQPHSSNLTKIGKAIEEIMEEDNININSNKIKKDNHDSQNIESLDEKNKNDYLIAEKNKKVHDEILTLSEHIKSREANTIDETKSILLKCEEICADELQNFALQDQNVENDEEYREKNKIVIEELNNDNEQEEKAEREKEVSNEFENSSYENEKESTEYFWDFENIQNQKTNQNLEEITDIFENIEDIKTETRYFIEREIDKIISKAICQIASSKTEQNLEVFTVIQNEANLMDPININDESQNKLEASLFGERKVEDENIELKREEMKNSLIKTLENINYKDEEVATPLMSFEERSAIDKLETMLEYYEHHGSLVQFQDNKFLQANSSLDVEETDEEYSNRILELGSEMSNFDSIQEIDWEEEIKNAANFNVGHVTSLALKIVKEEQEENLEEY